jgi:hypothetical protein
MYVVKRTSFSKYHFHLVDLDGITRVQCSTEILCRDSLGQDADCQLFKIHLPSWIHYRNGIGRELMAF